MVNISLAGKYLGKHDVLIMLLLAYDTKMGCLLKIKVKSDNEELSDELIQSIAWFKSNVFNQINFQFTRNSKQFELFEIFDIFLNIQMLTEIYPSQN